MHGGCVEIEAAMKVLMRGETGIEPRSAEEVESELCLREQLVPQVHREGWIGCAKASDEVVLEGTNSSFSYISSVGARWDQLELYVFVSEEIFQGLGTFVVEFVKTGSTTVADEVVVDFFVCGEDGLGAPIAYGADMACVAIEVEHEEDVLVTAGGRAEKATGEITEGFAAAGVPDGGVAGLRVRLQVYFPKIGGGI